MDNMRQLIAHWQWQSGFKMLCKQIFLFIIGNPKKIRLKCTIKIPGTKRICCPLWFVVHFDLTWEQIIYSESESEDWEVSFEFIPTLSNDIFLTFNLTKAVFRIFLKQIGMNLDPQIKLWWDAFYLLGKHQWSHKEGRISLPRQGKMHFCTGVIFDLTEQGGLLMR